MPKVTSEEFKDLMNEFIGRYLGTHRDACRIEIWESKIGESLTDEMPGVDIYGNPTGKPIGTTMQLFIHGSYLQDNAIDIIYPAIASTYFPEKHKKIVENTKPHGDLIPNNQGVKKLLQALQELPFVSGLKEQPYSRQNSSKTELGLYFKIDREALRDFMTSKEIPSLKNITLEFIKKNIAKFERKHLELLPLDSKEKLILIRSY